MNKIRCCCSFPVLTYEHIKNENMLDEHNESVTPK